MTLKITRSALESMTRQSRGCPTETGGLLVGVPEDLLVTHAGEPGPQAEKLAHRFTSDPDQDRAGLAAFRTQSGRRLAVLGYWHKHPQGMKSPSGGDLQQAKALLQEWQAAGDPDPGLLVVILQEADRPEQGVYAYLLGPGQASFTPLVVEVLEADDPAVAKALARLPAHLQSRPDHPWARAGFSFQHTPGGQERLARDAEALQAAGWQVSLRQLRENGRVVVGLERGPTRLLLRLPPEYPLCAPVVVGLPEEQELLPIPSGGFFWNSDRPLVEWVERCLPVSEVSRLPAAGLIWLVSLTLAAFLAWLLSRLLR